MHFTKNHISLRKHNLNPRAVRLVLRDIAMPFKILLKIALQIPLLSPKIWLRDHFTSCYSSKGARDHIIFITGKDHSLQPYRSGLWRPGSERPSLRSLGGWGSSRDPLKDSSPPTKLEPMFIHSHERMNLGYNRLLLSV